MQGQRATMLTGWLRTLISSVIITILSAGPLLSAQGESTPIRGGTTLPATCQAAAAGVSADVFVLSGGGSPGLYLCTATNTWTGPLSSLTILGTTNHITVSGVCSGSGTCTIDLSPIGHTIYVTLDGGGSTIPGGFAGYLKFKIPASAGTCTISDWVIDSRDAAASDSSKTGSITLDINRSGTSIIGTGNKPLLSSASNNSAAVSGWTSTTLSDADALSFVSSGVSSVIWVLLTLHYTC